MTWRTASCEIGTNADISTDSDTLKALIAVYRGEPKTASSADHSTDASTAPTGLVANQPRGASAVNPFRTNPPR